MFEAEIDSKEKEEEVDQIVQCHWQAGVAERFFRYLQF